MAESKDARVSRLLVDSGEEDKFKSLALPYDFWLQRVVDWFSICLARLLKTKLSKNANNSCYRLSGVIVVNAGAVVVDVNSVLQLWNTVLKFVSNLAQSGSFFAHSR